MKMLVCRFSSMGDIAIAVPVIKAVLVQNPSLEIVFVTRPQFVHLFPQMDRFTFFGADIDKEYKGILGLYKLYKKLNAQFSFNAVADLHNVTRTKILKYFFAKKGLQIATIDKGRTGKKKLVQKKNKTLQLLQTSANRYANVFINLGLTIVLENKRESLLNFNTLNVQIDSLFKPEFTYIGFAPFSKHIAKNYPIQKTEKVLEILSENKKIKIILFGGENEEVLLNKLSQKYPSTTYHNHLTLTEQLYLMSKLTLMVSMDSANMHLASLVGVKVLSIWGATHPFAGFLGYGQQVEDVIQKDLFCRPCSIYGNKKCYRKDSPYQCLDIEPSVIAIEIEKRLS